jgi:hypothetical protein
MFSPPSVSNNPPPVSSENGSLNSSEEDTGTEPYDHQEEAIVNNSTGSGKSLIAQALQFRSLYHAADHPSSLITAD